MVALVKKSDVAGAGHAIAHEDKLPWTTVTRLLTARSRASTPTRSSKPP